MALAGLRAYLVTGGLPNCFWPFAGHCFAVNQCSKSGAYEIVFGEVMQKNFVTGELVLFQTGSHDH